MLRKPPFVQTEIMLALMLSITLITIAGLLVQQAEPAQAVVDRYLAGLGGADSLERAGDISIEGTLRRIRRGANPAGAEAARLHIDLRREPFGYREVIEEDEGGVKYVLVSDGQTAWAVLPDGRSSLLWGQEAITLHDTAFLTRLAFLGEGLSNASPAGFKSISAREDLGQDQPIASVGLGLRTPAGTSRLLSFAPESGRLVTVTEMLKRDPREIRFGAWKGFDELTLPTLRVESRTGDPMELWFEIDDVSTGLSLSPDLFAGSPAEDLSEWHYAGNLDFPPGPVPGSGLLLVPDLILQKRVHVAGLFDTGSSGIGVAPALAMSLHLPTLGAQAVTAIKGRPVLNNSWIDQLGLGRASFMHLPVLTGGIPVSLADIVPTIISEVGLPSDPHFLGRSLFKPTAEGRVITGSLGDEAQYLIRWPLKAVRYLDKAVAWDLLEDPREMHPIPIQLDEFLGAANELLGNDRGLYRPTPLHVDAPESEELRDLQDLGYGGHSEER